MVPSFWEGEALVEPIKKAICQETHSPVRPHETWDLLLSFHVLDDKDLFNYNAPDPVKGKVQSVTIWTQFSPTLLKCQKAFTPIHCSPA